MTDSAQAEARILSGASWENFCDQLKAAGSVILRPETPANVFDRAEGWRYLTRLTRVALEMMLEFADTDFPVFYSATHATVKIGGDNPDNLYLNASISGARSYRIRGRRGSVRYLTFGTKANRFATTGTMVSTGELDAEEMQIDADGNFEIVLSRTRQPGNWLPLAEDSSMLLVRQTFLDRNTEQPAQLSITCLDGPARPAPLQAQALDHQLAAAAAFVNGTARTFADWAQRFSAQPNSLPRLDQSVFQRAAGSPSIFYYHGFWRLQADEALVIDTVVPACAYWGFVLQNYWMESMDYRYLPAYINKHSARYNADGTVTIVVAAQDAGVGNFLDTAGHSSGTMLLRWVAAAEHPQPHCRVVKLAALRGE